MSDPETDAKNNPAPELTGALHPEARFALLQAQTRRHFLRSFTAGVGSMFLGSLGSPFAPPANAAERNVDGSLKLDFTRDPTRPLRFCLRNLPLGPSESFICIWRGRQANWSFSITNLI